MYAIVLVLTLYPVCPSVSPFLTDKTYRLCHIFQGNHRRLFPVAKMTVGGTIF